MSEFLEDPIAMYEAQKASAAAVTRNYHRATRELFNSVKGKKWLRLAMAKHNFMGSVFSADDGMDAVTAAHRDGTRAFISEILNAAFDGKSKGGGAGEDDETSPA
ncbi:MAG: hypothetical protein EOP88_22780 [Verrucomicrobiaceae bacterium]|nr:MAG: hypothetical protein EOP88_22780 [Verrucomicrobiaceae bacterium]